MRLAPLFRQGMRACRGQRLQGLRGQRRLMSYSNQFGGPPNWWQRLPPVAKGILGGVVFSMVVLSFGKIFLLAALVGGVWYFYQITKRTPFSVANQQIPPSISSLMMSQVFRTVFASAHQRMALEKEVLRMARHKIKESTKIREVIGEVVGIHGPTAQHFLQTNNKTSVRLEFDIIGIKGPAELLLTFYVNNQGEAFTVSVEQMAMGVLEGYGAPRSIIVLEEADEHTKQEEIIVDGEVNEVKLSSKKR